MRIVRSALFSVVCCFATFPALASGQSSPGNPPAGWEDASSQIMRLLTLEGKEAEALATAESWVAKHPTFADAHFMLGLVHDSLARKIRLGELPGGAAAAIKHWEIAASQQRKVLDLKGSSAEFSDFELFMDLYSVMALNRPDEYARLVREGVKRYPKEPKAHAILLALLASRQEPLDEAARAARQAIGPGVEPRADLAAIIAYAVRDFGKMYGKAYSTSLLREALALLDEVLKVDPKHAYATKTKALVQQLMGQ